MSKFAIQATQIRAVLGAKEVLHNLDASIPHAKWTSVVGPNGAGKSTLLKVIAGLVQFDGQVLFPMRDEKIFNLKKNAQYLSWLGQNEGSADDLSVYDIFNLINKDLKNFSIFIISKSGNTLETIINFNLLIKKIGKKFMKNFIVISQRNTNLHKFAINNNLIFFEHNSNLSGRYSVLSEVGLIMFSINKKEILNAIQFVISKKFKKILIKNTAFLFTLMKFSKVNQHVFLIYSKELLNFGYWHQQLLAESIGKDSMDFTPWVSMCPKDNHSIMQLFLGGKKNKFFSFLKIVKNKKDYLLTKNNLLNKNLNNTKLSKVIDAQFNATVNVFKKNNIPHRVILINEKKPKDLISLFVYSMLETVLLCKMSRVNPFNQPAVESIKKETLRILK